MAWWRAVLQELARPDAQRGDWMAWSSNQLSHAFIGAVLAGGAIVLGYGAWPGAAALALAYAIFKEAPDFLRNPGWAAARDSVQDALFVAGGALLVAAVAGEHDRLFAMALVAVLVGLGWGVLERIKK